MNASSTTEHQPYTTAHHETLTNEAYQSHPNLFVHDCDRILHRLELCVQRFKQRFRAAPLVEQATRFVRHEAERHKITERILSEHSRVIHSAIHKNMWVSVVDLAVEHGDLFSEIAFEIHKRAHSLNRAGTAKLSTRLYALASTHVWLRYNSPNRRRWRLNESASEWDYGVTIQTDEERAALKADEKADAVWDAGYAEAGLSAY